MKTIMAMRTTMIEKNACVADSTSPAELTDEQRLLKTLRHNYDPAVRPVFDAKRPVVIDLGITLTQIIDVVSGLHGIHFRC